VKTNRQHAADTNHTHARAHAHAHTHAHTRACPCPCPCATPRRRAGEAALVSRLSTAHNPLQALPHPFADGAALLAVGLGSPGLLLLELPAASSAGGEPRVVLRAPMPDHMPVQGVGLLQVRVFVRAYVCVCVQGACWCVCACVRMALARAAVALDDAHTCRSGADPSARCAVVLPPQAHHVLFVFTSSGPHQLRVLAWQLTRTDSTPGGAAVCSRRCDA
jgi:hypothetical protein